MLVNGTVRLAYRPQAEVICPANQLSVDLGYPVLRRQQRQPVRGHLADRATHRDDLLLRRARANIGFTRLRRVTPTDCVPEEVK